MLNENIELVYSEIRTDYEGKIEIKHLVPGKYYLKETKTKEGYEINDKLIEVQVDMNEKSTVTITNNQEETQEEFKISKKIGNVKMNKLPVTGM